MNSRIHLALRNLLCALLCIFHTTARSEDFVFGVGTHLQGGTRDLSTSLARLSDAGAIVIRDDAPWQSVETILGVYNIPRTWDTLVDSALKQGIAPLLILDYGNPFYDNGDKPRSQAAIQAFSKYAAAVAGHFKGRVKRYEIWNEWEIQLGKTTPGTPEEYVALVQQVYPAIKKVDPSAEVLVGAVTPPGIRTGYLHRIVELGVLRTADALSLHTYVFRQAASTPEDWATWLQSVQNDLTSLTGKTQPFYITEMGWPTHQGKYGISLETQSQYVARLYLLARTMPFIKGMWWYDLQDDGTDAINPENNFGLVKNDFTPKPALAAMKAVASLTARGQFLGRVNTGITGTNVLKFKDADGLTVFAAWAENTSASYTLKIKSKLAHPPLSAFVIGSTAESPLPCQCPPNAVGCEASLSLTGTPTLVRTIIAKDLVISVERK